MLKEAIQPAHFPPLVLYIALSHAETSFERSMAVQHPLCQATTASHHRGTKGNHFLPKWYKGQYEDLRSQHTCDAEVMSTEGGCTSLGKSPALSGRWREDLAQQQPNMLHGSSSP